MPLNQDTPQWVAAYTNPRAEKKVAERLNKIGIENYLPLQKNEKKWSDRIQVVEEPVFKSYIFIKIRLNQVTTVREVEGIAYILNYHSYEHNETIPESQIQAIKTIIQSQTPFYVVPSQDFKEGEYVQITQGALTGQIGQIQSSGQQKNFYIRIVSLKMDLIVNAPKEYLITASRKDIKKNKI